MLERRDSFIQRFISDLGVVGTGAIGSRLMRGNTEALTNALGIAYHQGAIDASDDILKALAGVANALPVPTPNNGAHRLVDFPNDRAGDRAPPDTPLG